MHERDYQLRNAKRSNKSEHWSNYRRLRNQATYGIRKAKANYERSIFMENDLNPKDFWRQVKKCYPIKDKKIVSKTFMIANKPVSVKIFFRKCILQLLYVHVTSLINP